MLFPFSDHVWKKKIIRDIVKGAHALKSFNARARAAKNIDHISRIIRYHSWIFFWGEILISSLFLTNLYMEIDKTEIYTAFKCIVKHKCFHRSLMSF